MRPREDLIAAIDRIPGDKQLTLREICDLLGENRSNVDGWVSSERVFPVARRGSRNSKHYTKNTVIKIVLYAYALKQNGNFRVRGNVALEMIGEIDANQGLSLLKEGHQNFMQIFLANDAE